VCGCVLVSHVSFVASLTHWKRRSVWLPNRLTLVEAEAGCRNWLCHLSIDRTIPHPTLHLPREICDIDSTTLAKSSRPGASCSSNVTILLITHYHPGSWRRWESFPEASLNDDGGEAGSQPIVSHMLLQRRVGMISYAYISTTRLCKWCVVNHECMSEVPFRWSTCNIQ